MVSSRQLTLIFPSGTGAEPAPMLLAASWMLRCAGVQAAVVQSSWRTITRSSQRTRHRFRDRCSRIVPENQSIRDSRSFRITSTSSVRNTREDATLRWLVGILCRHRYQYHRQFLPGSRQFPANIRPVCQEYTHEGIRGFCAQFSRIHSYVYSWLADGFYRRPG